MNLADPELELIDPTPNVYNLFTHFDEIFFWTTLIGRAVVRWSKKMYSCAGICSYEGRNGICDIALSEPLLKLRPRKDLVETLLHEMIHAYLFITNRDNDRDGHGPTFQAHMHRINRAAGLNISIYHDFHAEVHLYQRHWWRCNGMCQKMKPYFGIVRRIVNKAPGPKDYWWAAHQRNCGGTFVKIKEPEIQKPTKSKTGKKYPDITKFINNNNNNTPNKNKTVPVNKEKKIVNIPVVKSAIPSLSNVVNISNDRISNPVVEKVRDVWRNKQIPPSVTKAIVPAKPVKNSSSNVFKTHKHKSDSEHVESPQKKIKKIDDYFKKASNILKDVYGEEFIISQSHSNNKLKVVKDPDHIKNFVNCPSCHCDVSSQDINRHLDECLNKDIIKSLTQESIQILPTTSVKDSKSHLNVIINDTKTIPAYKPKSDFKDLPDMKISNTDVNTSQSYEDLYNTKQTLNENKRQTDFKRPTTKDIDIVEGCSNGDPFKTKTLDKNIKVEPSENTFIQLCPCCGNKLDKPIEIHLKECLHFFDSNITIPEEGTSETVVLEDVFNTNIKSEPGTSKDVLIVQKCPCCGNKLNQPLEQHLEECLGFFNNDTTLPHEGSIETIVIDDDDDDEFDETQTFNATGTKSPCPCCLQMVENADMNVHLDLCLGKTGNS